VVSPDDQTAGGSATRVAVLQSAATVQPMTAIEPSVMPWQL
jgi:hypothetical protein